MYLFIYLFIFNVCIFFQEDPIESVVWKKRQPLCFDFNVLKEGWREAKIQWSMNQHQIKFSALVTLCLGDPPINGVFLLQSVSNAGFFSVLLNWTQAVEFHVISDIVISMWWDAIPSKKFDKDKLRSIKNARGSYLVVFLRLRTGHIGTSLRPFLQILKRFTD